MEPTTRRTVPEITCDGTGVVSHAGTVLLAELADRIGLTALLSEATDGLRERRAGHDPGRVLIDVAVAIADGAVTISDIQALADHEGLHGPAGSVASTSTIWRVLAGIDAAMLVRIRQARAEARDRAWTARGELTGSELPGSRAAGKTISEVVIDLDATLVTAHSEKEDAKGNFKGGFGHHPLGAWLDNTNEALAMLLRPGNAGSNTATDHLTVLEQALAQIPDRWRSKNVLIRADGAGYSHALISALSTQGLGFSVGYPVTEAVRDAIKLLPKWAWTAANNADGGLREHADVVEVTGMLDLSRWTATCPGMRVIVRREHPHPGRPWTPSRSVTATATKPSRPTPPAGSCRSWTPGTAPTPASKTTSAQARTPASGTCPPGTPTSTRSGSNSPSSPRTCSPWPSRRS